MVSYKNERLSEIKFIVPLSTPLDKNGNFHRDDMEKLVEHCLDGGADGLFILGSCGEFPCFEYDESKQIVGETLKLILGRVPSFIGIGRNSTKETLKMGCMAKEAGADYLVVIPPFYFKKIPNEELLAHYGEISKLDLPIIIYNMPPYSAELSGSFFIEACKIENIVGLKSSSRDLEFISQVSTILPTYTGSDTRVFDSMERGAIGGVCGLGNVFPSLFKDFFTTYESDKEKAKELQKIIKVAKEEICSKAPNSQVGIKMGLEYLGICSSKMREPNGQATDEAKKKVFTFMSEFETEIDKEQIG